jgi:hypothetical protein
VAKTELARQFGVCRRTIYHWIETGQLDRDLEADPVQYRPRPAVPTLLDPYPGIIQARLAPSRFAGLPLGSGVQSIRAM